MLYDFDAVIDRRGTDSLKVDFFELFGKDEGLLPMWVADMDFSVADEVLGDLRERVNRGVFGYSEAKSDYYDAVIKWFGERFGYVVESDEIVKAPGIVFALAQAIRAFTREGDGVILQTPVYYPFYEIIRNNGRRIEANKLIYSNGRFEMDFEDFERLAAKPDVKLFILCSPHNPVSRVWKREELSRINDICKRNGVLVASDEIHCDFVWPGSEHVCYGLLDEDAVVCTAPTKTFNLAGLQISNLFVKNERLRRDLKTEIRKSGYSQLNTFGLAACKSAYTKGALWLGELREYILGNIALARDFLRERLPDIRLVEPEGTYLLWLDFSAYGLSQAELDRRVTGGAGLWLDSGTMFGADGEGFQRVNVACPRSVLARALEQLAGEFGEG